jgi:hypothetical protein
MKVFTTDNVRKRYVADAFASVAEGSCSCDDLLDRISTLEMAVANMIPQQEDPDLGGNGEPLPRSQWPNAQATDAREMPDDDAGSGGAKNRGIPSQPKVFAPGSGLPDAGDANRRNPGPGALVNEYTGPNSDGNIDVPARFSKTPKVMQQKTFGVIVHRYARLRSTDSRPGKQTSKLPAFRPSSTQHTTTSGGKLWIKQSAFNYQCRAAGAYRTTCPRIYA